MSERFENKSVKVQTVFSREIGSKVALKLKARRNSGNEVWFGLGMMGLIGWSVVVPMLLCVAFGIWLDKRLPESHSWMLLLLVIGLVIGCLNAWHWVAKEDREMQEDNNE